MNAKIVLAKREMQPLPLNVDTGSSPARILAGNICTYEHNMNTWRFQHRNHNMAWRLKHRKYRHAFGAYSAHMCSLTSSLHADFLLYC